MADLHYTRIFDAPRDLVFRCMVEPEQLAHFWGPEGTHAPVDRITVDARPGGAFETVMIDDASGAEYPTRAVYAEVVEPDRLAWDESPSGMHVTVIFTELGPDRTEVHIHQTKVPEAAISPAAQAGFRTSLDRFAAYLATERT